MRNVDDIISNNNKNDDDDDDKPVCVSLHANAFRKGMNPSLLLPPAMGK